MEKFNSGMGGYICDFCSKLLWAGFSDHRIYCYEATPATIVEHRGLFFCNGKCVKRYEDLHDEDDVIFFMDEMVH